jgi:uncharacterized repeat protein (TIGR03803 family)
MPQDEFNSGIGMVDGIYSGVGMGGERLDCKIVHIDGDLIGDDNRNRLPTFADSVRLNPRAEVFAMKIRSRASWKSLFLFCMAVSIISPAQEFKTLTSLNDTDGESPRGALAQGIDGNLYGTTATDGVAFTLTLRSKLTVLEYFSSVAASSPITNLAQTRGGRFYGTTADGGGSQVGTVFELTPTGTLSVLYDFCAQTGCTDGSVPLGGVVLATDGNLYGTTSGGGAIGDGTVFKITLQGALSVIYSFCSQPNCADGYSPVGPLVQATDDNFYGTVQLGGASGCGTVFRVTPSGTLTTLHSFIGTDGQTPVGGLVQAPDGNFYGVTESGGPGGSCGGAPTAGTGTVFMVTPEGTLTTLYSFCSQPSCADGASPLAGLIRATDGNFYGTTQFGGTTIAGQCPDGCGTIFKITPQGTLTTLHSFVRSDGDMPSAGLIQATNGVLYGTTLTGGTVGNGTIFGVDIGLDQFVETLPASGAIGSTIDILSQGLTGTTAVSFNGIAASFTVVSDTYLTATIPGGATTGYVSITTPSATLKSNLKFRVVL